MPPARHTCQMQQHVAFHHTSPVHVATFERLMQVADPAIKVEHAVHEDLWRTPDALAPTTQTWSGVSMKPCVARRWVVRLSLSAPVQRLAGQRSPCQPAGDYIDLRFFEIVGIDSLDYVSRGRRYTNIEVNH